MKKKIIVIVLSVIVAAALITGAVFLIKDSKKDSGNYGDVKGVEVINEYEIELRYSAPYLGKNTRYSKSQTADITATHLVNGKEKKQKGNIESVLYERINGEKYKTGEITLKIKFSKALESNVNYHLVIKENSFTTKKDDYKNKEITADFSFDKKDDGTVESKDELYYNSTAVLIENPEAVIKNIDGKNYIMITADVDKRIDTYNKSAVDNLSLFFFLSYTEGGKNAGFVFNNVQSSVKDGVISVKAPIEDKYIIPGQEYSIFISRGIFTSADKLTVCDECNFEFTHVE